MIDEASEWTSHVLSGICAGSLVFDYLTADSGVALPGFLPRAPRQPREARPACRLGWNFVPAESDSGAGWIVK
jgi:hypothetical protein